MTSTPRFAVGFVFCLIVVAPVDAAQKKPAGKELPEKSMRQQAFERSDKNGDDELDVEEFLGGSVGKAGESKRREFSDWDLNGDERVDFEEYKKKGNRPADKKLLEKLFSSRDTDNDKILTLEEFIGDRSGEARIEAEETFYRVDRDENDCLSLDEFLNRKSEGRLGTRGQFRQRDVDKDGKLSLDEFSAKVSAAWKESTRKNFQLFDVDEDGHLNEREFAITPAQKPEPNTMFHGLDVDEDGELTIRELTRLMSDKRAYWARQTFVDYDRNGNGGLSLDEYLARDVSLMRKATKRWWGGWLDTWGFVLLIVIDILLVVVIIREVRRWMRGRSSDSGRVSARSRPTIHKT